MEDLFVLRRNDFAVIWLITSNSSNLGGLKLLLEDTTLGLSALWNRNLIPSVGEKAFHKFNLRLIFSIDT